MYKIDLHKRLWIYESYIFKLRIKREYESDRRSSEHYLSSSENRAWKNNSGLYEIWAHDLCHTGAVLYQLS